MKKFLLSSFVILSFLLYAAAQKILGHEVQVQPLAVPQSNNVNQLNVGNFPTTNQPTMMPGHMMNTSYRDGTYTGDVADAFYGYVQVQVTVSGGKITDVQFLDYPQDRRTSVEINSQATPYLRQEAIQAQSANVNIVSGATQTSRAFIESLGSALSKAI